MSEEYNKSSHVTYEIKYHVIWVTKYRYKVLGGNMSKRLRELIFHYPIKKFPLGFV